MVGGATKVSSFEHWNQHSKSVPTRSIRLSRQLSNLTLILEQGKTEFQQEINLTCGILCARASNTKKTTTGHRLYLNDKRVDGSDDLHNVDSVMYSKSSRKRRKSTDCISASSQVKKSKTEPGVTSIKELIHSLIEFLSNNRIATSPASDEPSIEKCIDMLGNMSNDIPAGSDLYNYTLNMFLEKEIRQMFVKLPTNEVWKSWLECNHRLFLKKYGL